MSKPNQQQIETKCPASLTVTIMLLFCCVYWYTFVAHIAESKDINPSMDWFFMIALFTCGLLWDNHLSVAAVPACVYVFIRSMIVLMKTGRQLWCGETGHVCHTMLDVIDKKTFGHQCVYVQTIVVMYTLLFGVIGMLCVATLFLAHAHYKEQKRVELAVSEEIKKIEQKNKQRDDKNTYYEFPFNPESTPIDVKAPPPYEVTPVQHL